MCFVSLEESSIKHYRLSTFRRLDYWLIQVKHSYRKACDRSSLWETTVWGNIWLSPIVQYSP